MTNKFKDITNKKFNRLTAIEYIKKDKYSRHALWKCICDCGNKVYTTRRKLEIGDSKSCGCLKKEYNNRLATGIAAINSLYTQYKIQAKYRKLNFDLSLQQFKNLIFKNCHYCGNVPKTIHKTKSSDNKGHCVYNGIDRKINHLGYTLDNSLTCCKICNKMKSNYSYEYFLDHINKTAKHLRKYEKV